MATTVYDDRATALQNAVISADLEQLKDVGRLGLWDGPRVRQSVVHTRQDVVMLVSHLSSLNEQVASIRRLLWLIAVLVAGVLLTRW